MVFLFVVLQSLRLVRELHGASSALFEDLIYDCDVGIDFFLNQTVTFDVARRQRIVSAE